jgi:hypothetical protein
VKSFLSYRLSCWQPLTRGYDIWQFVHDVAALDPVYPPHGPFNVKEPFWHCYMLERSYALIALATGRDLLLHCMKTQKRDCLRRVPGQFDQGQTSFALYGMVLHLAPRMSHMDPRSGAVKHVLLESIVCQLIVMTPPCCAVQRLHSWLGSVGGTWIL